MATLIRCQRPEADRMIAEWLENADFQTSFYILMNAKTYLQANALDQMFGSAAPSVRFGKYLELVKARHGELGDVLDEIFTFRDNLSEIVKRRNYVTEPEHRFFLALLMNVEDKERIFSLVKQRFPNDEPLDKVLDWTFDLAQTKIAGTNLPNALGIHDFGDFELMVLENLLQDKSDAQTRESLKEDFPAENAAEFEAKIDSTIEKIRSALIFRPLLGSSN